MTKNKPIYVVIGGMRTGTTMMMDAILAGSDLKPIYTKARTERFSKEHDGKAGGAVDDGYKLNNGKLWELDRCTDCAQKWKAQKMVGIDIPLPECGVEDCHTTFFNHPDRFQGMLLKHIPRTTFWLLPEWEGGYKAIFTSRSWIEAQQSYDGAFGEPYPVSREMYLAQVFGWWTTCKHWKKMVWMRDIIEKPEEVFFSLDLIENFDYKKASAVVKPELYRFREEKLHKIPCKF